MVATNVNTIPTVRMVHMPVVTEDHRQVCVEKPATESLVLLVGIVERI